MSDAAPRRVLTRVWPSLADELALEILQYMGAPELVRLRVAGAWFRNFIDHTPETAAALLVGLLERRIAAGHLYEWLPRHIAGFIDNIPQALLERGIGASELAAAGPPDHWLSQRMQRVARVRVVWLRGLFEAEAESESSQVACVSWSADGGRLFGGLCGGSIRVWSGADGSELDRLDCHTNLVTSIAVSSDDSRLVSGSYDGTVRMWQRTDGDGLQQHMYECVRVLDHGVSVWSVVLSHSGQLIVSSDLNGRIRLYRADSGELVHTLEGHRSGVTSLAFTADDRRLVSGSFDVTVRLWDVDSGAEVRVMEGHTDVVRCVAVSGRWIVSGSDDRTVRLFDIDSGKCVQVMEGRRYGVYGVAFVDDNTAVSVSDDKTVRWWRLSDGVLLHTFNTTRALFTCAVSGDGRIAIVGDSGAVGVLEWKK